MDKDKKELLNNHNLFDKIVNIVEGSRKKIAEAVNSNIILAYWFIGYEIVMELQKGAKRAKYGTAIIENLSKQLTEKYGDGFSVTSLQYFRKFYQVYSDRISIPRQGGVELKNEDLSNGNSFDLSILEKPRTGCVELNNEKLNNGNSFDLSILEKPRTGCVELRKENIKGFTSQLTWSHYRLLMRVEEYESRLFYEQESIECAWTHKELKRQINSLYYERLLKHSMSSKMLEESRHKIIKAIPPIEMLKSSYVLEFLNLPESSQLQESELEAAIITHLQKFLLELDKGFAFVARQKKMRYNHKDLYIDLVFYNTILKCYMLVDLKVNELSYQDIGQMDGYVRMFNDLYTAEDDNPTIGLILCTDKDDSIVKYSILNESKEIFASKYQYYFPTEKELKIEIEKERKLIESRISSRS